jgi:hypothetical protein
MTRTTSPACQGATFEWTVHSSGAIVSVPEIEPIARVILRAKAFSLWIVRRQLVFPIVLPHSEMLPENCALFCPESGVGASMKNLSTVRPFCRILNLVGEAEAGSGGDQPAKE